MQAREPREVVAAGHQHRRGEQLLHHAKPAPQGLGDSAIGGGEENPATAQMAPISGSGAHELNNPLAVLRISLDGLKLAADPSGASRGQLGGGEVVILGHASEAVDRRVSLVDHLKSASRRSTNRPRLEELNTIAERAAAVVHRRSSTACRCRSSSACLPR